MKIYEWLALNGFMQVAFGPNLLRYEKVCNGYAIWLQYSFSDDHTAIRWTCDIYLPEKVLNEEMAIPFAHAEDETPAGAYKAVIGSLYGNAKMLTDIAVELAENFKKGE